MKYLILEVVMYLAEEINICYNNDDYENKNNIYNKN